VAVRAEGGADRAPRAGSGRLDAMPLRRKLDILVVVPLIIILLLAIPIAANEFRAAHNWRSAAGSMNELNQVSTLINDLEIEQAVAVGLQGASADPGHPSADSTANLKYYAAQTDAELAAVHGSVHPDVSTSLGQALAEVVYETQGPAGGRATALDQPAPDKSAAVEVAYNTAITSLDNALDLDAVAAAGGSAAFPEAELDFLYNANLREHDRELDLLALTNQADLDNEDGGAMSLDWPDLTAVEQDYGVSQSYAINFDAVAASKDENLLEGDTATAAANYITDEQQSVEQAMSDANPAEALDQVLTSDQFGLPGSGGGSSLGLLQAIVQAHQERDKTQTKISGDVIAATQHEANLERWYGFGLLAGAILVLAALIALEYRVRRSVVTPMIRLTQAATQIAEVTRADLERVADEDDAGVEPQGLPVFETVTVSSRDELGTLAEAFNKVQDSAVRVLERQIAVRRNTAEMFGNVGRRIHNLTGRQLALIDAAEREETDPSVLERLYRIDHIAVRLQRGADSLMLLSGETETAIGDAPLRLTDVVRSAVGRVEGYQRVVLSAEGDVTVAPAAVGDLTLIVAELVENAVSFSPGSSSVDISVRPTIQGAYVEIVDHGVGMRPARLDEENARLVRRERLDLAPTKVLGLFVVGRLARRSGISVRLSSTPGGGVSARLDIGKNLLFDRPEPPARRRPAQAARSVRPGTPGPLLPEQRVTRAEGTSAPSAQGPAAPVRPPAPSSPNPAAGGASRPDTVVTPGFDALPVRRRTPRQPGNGVAPATETNGHKPATAPEPLPRRISGADNGAPSAAPATPRLDADPLELARRIREAVAPHAEAPMSAAGATLEAPISATETTLETPMPELRGLPLAAPEPVAPAAAPAEPEALPRRSRNRAAVRESAPSVSAFLADAHLLDAEAARAAVEEFEAGVEEAMRVSAQNLPTLRASDESEGIRP
jgi:signal transduction histidine kinase